MLCSGESVPGVLPRVLAGPGELAAQVRLNVAQYQLGVRRSPLRELSGGVAVMVHGWGGAPTCWGRLEWLLAQRGVETKHVSYRRNAPFEGVLDEVRSLVSDLPVPIVFGHSMGGVVARHALAGRDGPGLLVTLSSPHAGLRPYLLRLGFLEPWIERHVDRLLPLSSDTEWVALAGTSDFLVAPSSSLPAEASCRHLVPAGHGGVLLSSVTRQLLVSHLDAWAARTVGAPAPPAAIRSAPRPALA